MLQPTALHGDPHLINLYGDHKALIFNEHENAQLKNSSRCVHVLCVSAVTLLYTKHKAFIENNLIGLTVGSHHLASAAA